MSHKTGQSVKNFVAVKTEKWTVENPILHGNMDLESILHAVQNRPKTILHLFCIVQNKTHKKSQDKYNEFRWYKKLTCAHILRSCRILDF